MSKPVINAEIAASEPSVAALYEAHVNLLRQSYEQVLAQTNYEAVLIDAGPSWEYFADDRHGVFVPTPHFAHWTPLASPDHVLVVVPGQRPILFMYRPEDFWHETDGFRLPQGGWRVMGRGEDVFDLSENLFEVRVFSKLSDLETDVVQTVGKKRCVLVGPPKAAFSDLGWDINPKGLTARLDWNRATKTPYEIFCLKAAQQSAALAHEKTRQRYLAGPASEFELHLAFLAGAQMTEADLPYQSIVALNERARILHYQNKRVIRETKDFSFLIDAGTQFRGYASDVTRTYSGRDSSQGFQGLLRMLNDIQKQLVAAVKPGKPFVELHEECHLKIATCLREAGILKNLSLEAIVAKGLSRVFFPHGLGHHLGLQVHDIGGKQATPEGDPVAPPAQVPGGTYLRNLRTLEPGHVITIEPGIYFIPSLINPHLEGENRVYFDQDVIADLSPHGGIRIEDDVLVTVGGAEVLG